MLCVYSQFKQMGQEELYDRVSPNIKQSTGGQRWASAYSTREVLLNGLGLPLASKGSISTKQNHFRENVFLECVSIACDKLGLYLTVGKTRCILKGKCILAPS